MLPFSSYLERRRRKRRLRTDPPLSPLHLRRDPLVPADLRPSLLPSMALRQSRLLSFDLDSSPPLPSTAFPSPPPLRSRISPHRCPRCRRQPPPPPRGPRPPCPSSSSSAPAGPSSSPSSRRRRRRCSYHDPAPGDHEHCFYCDRRDRALPSGLGHLEPSLPPHRRHLLCTVLFLIIWSIWSLCKIPRPSPLPLPPLPPCARRHLPSRQTPLDPPAQLPLPHGFAGVPPHRR